jgi:hypothetical protein
MAKLYFSYDSSIPDEVMHVDTAKAIIYLQTFFEKTRDPRVVSWNSESTVILNMIKKLIPQHADEIRRYQSEVYNIQNIQYTVEGLLSSGEKINAYRLLVERRNGWGDHSLYIKTQCGELVSSLNAWLEYYTEKMSRRSDAQIPVYKKDTALYIRGPNADRDRKRQGDEALYEEMLREEHRRQFHGRYT